MQSSDQAHGATGTAIARILDVPHAAVIVEMEWDGENKLTLARELEGGMRHNIELATPAVVSIQTGINMPRFATMKMIKQAKQKPLVVVDGAGLFSDGSGGYVVRRMYVPEQTKAEMLKGTPQEVAQFYCGSRAREERVLTMPGILIIAEHLDGVVRDITRGNDRRGAIDQGRPPVVPGSSLEWLSSNPDALTPSVQSPKASIRDPLG